MASRPCCVPVVLVLLAALFGSRSAAQTGGSAPGPLVGAYRSPSGGLVLVGYETTTAITVRDLERGLRGTLEAAGTDRFIRGKASLTVLRAAGAINAIQVEDSSGSRRVLARIPLRMEPVSWQSDTATLSGTLVMPQENGPHALIVVQPGSSWQTRYNEHGMFTALTFAAGGIAGLAYDKRGFGESSGEQLVTFEQTATDLARGVDAMRRRFDIRPDAIGIFGLSQGGWIAPLAATQTDGAFLVLVGPPGTTPARQETQRAVAVLRAEGAPDSVVRDIRDFQEVIFRYSATGEGWPEYLALRARGKAEGWLGRVYSPDTPGPGAFMWGRLNGYYNPLPALLKTRIPVLALWGAFDLNVNPEVNRSIFEGALQVAGNRDVTLEIVPNADHELEYAASARDALNTNRFTREVWAGMVDWVKARTTTEPGG